MSKGTHAHHRPDPEEETVETSPNRTDPVCGMEVEENSPHRFSLDGEEYLFCSSHCRETFRDNPGRFLEDQEAGQEPSGEGREEPGESVPGKEYTCPMHPEIRQEGAGDCPKCGMALEPVTPAAAVPGTNGSVPCTRKSSGTRRATARSAGWRWSPGRQPSTTGRTPNSST